MGRILVKTTTAVAKAVAVCAALALVLVALAAGSAKTAWAEWPNTATITIATVPGDTSMGWVGFEPNQREALIEREFAIGEEVTLYATAAPGYEFQQWNSWWKDGHYWTVIQSFSFTVEGDFGLQAIFRAKGNSTCLIGWYGDASEHATDVIPVTKGSTYVVPPFDASNGIFADGHAFVHRGGVSSSGNSHIFDG